LQKALNLTQSSGKTLRACWAARQVPAGGVPFDDAGFFDTLERIRAEAKAPDVSHLFEGGK